MKYGQLKTPDGTIIADDMPHSRAAALSRATGKPHIALLDDWKGNLSWFMVVRDPCPFDQPASIGKFVNRLNAQRQA